MNLKDRLKNDIKEAMRNKNTLAKTVIRFITTAIKQREVDERIELEDGDIIKIIQKEMKQRDDAIKFAKEALRDDLVEQNEAEKSELAKYLPKQLNDDELKNIVLDVISKVGAVSTKDMGKVMGVVSKEVGSSADGKRVSSMVRELLN